MSKNRAQTRAVRERMAQTGESYVQALNALGGAGTGTTKGPADVSLRSILTTLAIADRREDARMNHAYADIEARGFVLIDAGQVGEDDWEIVEFRTGKLLARGSDGHSGFDAAHVKLEETHKLYHVDAVFDDVRPNDVTDAINKLVGTGLPSDLLDSLANWVSMASADDLAGLVDTEILERGVSNLGLK